ncbi:hypothetical protein EDD11_001351 [Mortierella claussenii]|nr:hypothetical protein EDD11_001351 [Mortierella claussenii]
MRSEHSMEDCPLRMSGCITTTDTFPYRILDLDIEALDLFLTGYTLDSTSPPSFPASHHHGYHDPYAFSPSPVDPYFDYPAQLARARACALRFLTGLSIADVLLPDAKSCLRTTCGHHSSVQPFIVAEDAMPSTAHIDSDDRQRLSLKRTVLARRVHACVHHSSTARQLGYSTSYRSTHHSDSNNTATSGYRLYKVRDVTEVHGLALAARNGIRASGRLQQRQQPFITRQQSVEHTHREITTSVPVPPPSPAAQEAASKQPNAVLCSQDFGVQFEDRSCGSNDATDSATTTTNTAVTAIPPTSDPGLLILQVTRFGTIDHAFAIPQQEQYDSGKEGCVSCPDQDQPLFLAQNKSAIETLASSSLMAHVHPDDLAVLCKGVDQVCKAVHTVFRARWRVDVFDELPWTDEALDSDDDDSDEEDDDYEAYLNADAEGTVRTIEFQGEMFEEWVDPFSAASQCTSSPLCCPGFVWTEITGVLSHGNPVLVVRPLTLSELEESGVSTQAHIVASAISVATTTASSHDLRSDSPFADATSDDDDGYLEMEIDLDMDQELDQRETIVEDADATLVHKKEMDSMAVLKKSQIWKRMDQGEGLYLCQNNSLRGLSGLRTSLSASPLSSSSAAAIAAQKESNHHHPRQRRHNSCNSINKNGNRHHHHHHISVAQQQRSPFFKFSTTSLITVPTWPQVSSVFLDARKQWIYTVHLTQEQFQAWCEHLLDNALDQAIRGVSLGAALLLGTDLLQPYPLPPYPYPHFSAAQWAECTYDFRFQLEQQEQEEGKQGQQVAVISNLPPQAPFSDSTTNSTQKISGLDRVGKVLEAKCPALEGMVRQIGNSWLGQRVLASSPMDTKALDDMADQVVDWWESHEDKIAAVVAYTPLSFLTMGRNTTK